MENRDEPIYVLPLAKEVLKKITGISLVSVGISFTPIENRRKKFEVCWSSSKTNGCFLQRLWRISFTIAA